MWKMETQRFLRWLLYRKQSFSCFFPVNKQKSQLRSIFLRKADLQHPLGVKGRLLGLPGLIQGGKSRRGLGWGGASFPGSCAVSEVASSDSTGTWEWGTPSTWPQTCSHSHLPSWRRQVLEVVLERFQTFRRRFAWMNSCIGFGWMIEFRWGSAGEKRPTLFSSDKE